MSQNIIEIIDDTVNVNESLDPIQTKKSNNKEAEIELEAEEELA